MGQRLESDVAEEELHQMMARLTEPGGGILPMHDTKRSTAAMMPTLLSWLKANGFSVVHTVPAGPEKP